MKLIKILGVVGALGVLAACTSDLQRIRTTEPSGGTPFTQALTKEYRDLAVFEADEMFDAKVTVLGEYIRHHAGEEENEMFPKVKKAKAFVHQRQAESMRVVKAALGA